MEHPSNPTIPTPTVPARIDRRQALLRRAEVVTVTSFADTSTAASTASAGTHVPVGPIVGGIVAGIVAVCLVGGIWWWCHHKAEKERKERKARLLAKASRSTGALSARPSLTPTDSGLSMQTLSHGKRGGQPKPSIFSDAAPAVPTVPYTSGEREQPELKSRRAAPFEPSATPPSSHSAPSSRRHRHERSLSREPAPPAPVALAPVVQPGTHRYQPARPSPLALAAKSQTSPSDARSPVVSPASFHSRSREGSLSASGLIAGERKTDDNAPKWGQKPFRSVATTPSDPSSPTGDLHGIDHVNQHEESEDDDPFEHAKYDRHRSTASTQVSSIAGSTHKRDTVRQSRDRDVMGGIGEWQEEMAGAREPSHQRGPSYPYSQQQGYAEQYQPDGTRGMDPFYGDDNRKYDYR